MPNRRPELVLILLCSFFLVFVFLGYILQGQTITLIGGPIAVLQVDQTRYPLNIGIFSFQIFFLAGALVFLDLVNEFFGKGAAIFLSLTGGAAIVTVWAFLNHPAYAPFLDLEPRSVFSLAGSIVAGFSFTSLIFELFRRMTYGGFPIIRLFMAHLLGLALFSAFGTVLENEPPFIFGEALSTAITRYIQWLMVSFLVIPIFYLLRAPFRLLIGKKHDWAMKERFAKNKIFRHDEKNFFEARSRVQEKRI